MPEFEPLRLVFAGTPEFAAAHLQALIDSPHELVAVYTQPDRRSGRGKKLLPSPVKSMAEAGGIAVKQPLNFKEQAAIDELAELRADAMIVVAYGLILPQAVLDAPRLGCINVHASLLPRWRGAAPIQRAVEAGDSDSGITIMQMEAGLDTGPMLTSQSVPLGSDMTGGELHDQFMDIGPPLLVDVVNRLDEQLKQASIQTGEACYAHKIDRAEAQLDWSQANTVLHNKIRAFNPVPVAWTLLHGERLKVWQSLSCAGDGSPGQILSADADGIVVACGTGALCLKTLQMPGGKALAVADLLNSRRDQFQPGTILDN